MGIWSTFLCLRRGVSSKTAEKKMPPCFSLPTQRCFYVTDMGRLISVTFLCLRRGVSRLKVIPVPKLFLFSAYAEVFPVTVILISVGLSFLCLRRGVSHCFDAAAYAAGFSLPTQRCFLTQPLVEAQKTLFSAYAEVFPIGARSDPARKTFLCLRRGVSP